MRAAVVSVDPRNGEVKAYYGGAVANGFDFAQAGLQTGSSFKVFALVAALKQGIGLGTQIDSGPLTVGKTKSGGRRKAGVIADAVEAILAAVYRDGGLSAAKAMFDIAWAEEFASPPAPAVTNPKSALQEWAQAQGRPLPTYRVVERTGSDHAPTFVVEATVVGFDPVQQTGRSRQEAEKAAATALLKREGVI